MLQLEDTLYDGTYRSGHSCRLENNDTASSVIFFFYTQAWLKSVQKLLQNIIIAHRAAKKDPTYHKNNRKILNIVKFFLGFILCGACTILLCIIQSVGYKSNFVVRVSLKTNFSHERKV